MGTCASAPNRQLAKRGFRALKHEAAEMQKDMLAEHIALNLWRPRERPKSIRKREQENTLT